MQGGAYVSFSIHGKVVQTYREENKLNKKLYSTTLLQSQLYSLATPVKMLWEVFKITTDIIYTLHTTAEK